MSNHFTHTLVLRVAALCSVLCCTFSSGAAQSERGGAAQIGEYANFHFGTAFAALSQQNKISFVFEGEPFVRVLSLKTQQNLAKALEPTQTLDSQIRAIAEAYDYKVESVYGNVYALTKRYNAEDDLPLFSLPETETRLQRLLSVCGDYVVSSSSKPLYPVLNSLSAEQKLAATEKEGIAVQSLSAGQKKHMHAFFSSFGFGYLGVLKNIERRFRACRTDRVTFHRKLPKPFRVYPEFPAYTGPFGETGAIHPVLLGYSTIDGRGIKKNTHGEIPLDADPASAIDPYVASRPTPISQTLTNVVASLKASSRWSSSGLSELYVDEAVVNKPVYVVGMPHANKIDDVVDALAATCDLQVRHAQTNLRLAVPNVGPLTSAAQVPEYARLMLPSAFHRVVAAAILRQGGRWLKVPYPVPANMPDSHRANNERMEDARRATQDKHDGPRRLYLVALRRLRTLLDPKLKQPPDGILSISALGDEVRSLIVLTTLAEIAESLEHIQRPSPSYMVHFEEARIHLNRVPNRNNAYQYHIWQLNAQGKGSGFIGSIMGGPPIP